MIASRLLSDRLDDGGVSMDGDGVTVSTANKAASATSSSSATAMWDTLVGVVRFVLPFVAEVAVPSVHADGLVLPSERGLWAAADAAAARYAPAGSPSSTAEAELTAFAPTQREACIGLLLRVLDAGVAKVHDAHRLAALCRWCVCALLRCGAAVEAVLQHGVDVHNAAVKKAEQARLKKLPPPVKLRKVGDDGKPLPDDDDDDADEAESPKGVPFTLEGLSALAVALFVVLPAAGSVTGDGTADGTAAALPDAVSALSLRGAATGTDDSHVDDAPAVTTAATGDVGTAAAASGAALPPLVPAVVTPVHWLHLCGHYVVNMLTACCRGGDAAVAMSQHTLALLSALMAPVRPGGNYIQDSSVDPELCAELRLCQGLFAFMLCCPVPELRQRAYRAFDAYISTFHAGARCVCRRRAGAVCACPGVRVCVCVCG